MLDGPMGLDGFGTLRHVVRDPPHLVVLDLNMPGLDGGELADRIQGHADTIASNVLFLWGLTEGALARTVVERGTLGGIREGADLGGCVTQFDAFARTLAPA